MKTLLFFTLIYCQLSFVNFSSAQWTWQNPLPQGNGLSSVFFTDADNGFSVGGVGTILKTSDAGTTWKAQSSGTSNTLYSVCFTDADNGFAVGSSGTILRTTNGGLTGGFKSENVLENSEVTIYPNPCNEQTIYVKGIMPANGIARITIYNLTGQIVKKMQIAKAASSHPIDISDVLKGIYILKFQTNENVINRKVVVQ